MYEERLAVLFRGLERAHGISKPTGTKNAKGKAETRYVSKREPVTPEVWKRHLAGEEGLVAVPIRDDGTAGFGAIDVDVYNLDLPALAKRVEELKLPLVVCRTKSGGAHLYLFLVEPLDAELIQTRLTNWAALLGYPRSEIFPKQTELASTEDMGNGINVPYYAAERTMRYALGPDGKALSLAEFVARAESLRATANDLPELDDAVDKDLDDAPPCLQHWARIGVGEGERNKVMFDFAIYAKRKWPSDWAAKFESFNHRYAHPPLPAAEVLTIVKSVGKAKDYLYQSKCEGPYCQPQLCRKKEHGRGGGYDTPSMVVDGLTVILSSPRIFYVNVNGRRLKLTGSQLYTQREFMRELFEQLLMVWRPLKPGKWGALVERLVRAAEYVEAPPDASPEGQLIHHLCEFVDKYRARDRNEILLEKAWLDPLSQRIYFRSNDLLAFLMRERVRGIAGSSEVYNAIRQAGGGDGGPIKIKGKSTRLWYLPAELRSDAEPLDVPDVSKKPEAEAPY